MLRVDVPISNAGNPTLDLVLLRPAVALEERADGPQLPQVPVLRHIAEPLDTGGAVGGVGVHGLFRTPLRQGVSQTFRQWLDVALAKPGFNAGDDPPDARSIPGQGLSQIEQLALGNLPRPVRRRVVGRIQPIHTGGQILRQKAKLFCHTIPLLPQPVPHPHLRRIPAGQEEHRNLSPRLVTNPGFRVAVSLVAIQHEDEVLNLAELPECRRMFRELVSSRISTDTNRLVSDSQLWQEIVEYALQDAFRHLILTQQVERFRGAAIERVLNQVTVGWNHNHLTGVITIKKDSPVWRYRIEHDRAMRSDDDLQVTAQGELLEL